MIRKLFLIAASIILIAVNSIFSQSNSLQKTVTLFELSSEVQKLTGDDPEIIQKQNIQINEAIYQKDTVSEGDRIMIPLFSGDTVEAEITRISTNVMGTTSITGKIPGEIPGNIIITYKGRRLFGTLHLYDQHRHFNLKSDSKTSEHYLVEKDIEAMAPLECGGAITVSDDRRSDIMDHYQRDQ